MRRLAVRVERGERVREALLRALGYMFCDETRLADVAFLIGRER